MEEFESTTTLIENNCHPPCDCTVIYVIVGILSALLLLITGVTLVFFRLYRKEQSLRLAMWKVKMSDVSEEVKWSPPSMLKTKKDMGIYSSYDCLEILNEDNMEVHGKKQFYTETCYYKGRIAAVKRLQTRRMSLEKNRISELDQIFMLNHDHICPFYGANYEGLNITILTEYCNRGSLQDLLENQTDWDDEFKNSLIFDIVKGMQYLHHSVIHSHGNLKPSNCLVDGRFVVKITDFGAIGQRIKVKKKVSNDFSNQTAFRKLWTAPELLREVNPPAEGTQAGDVYSFAIIAQEILFQRGVFYRKSENCSAEDIVNKVMNPALAGEIFRPTLADDDYVIIPQIWRRTLKLCWHESDERRATFDTLYKVSRSFQKEGTYIDSLMERLEKYSNHLEEKVEEKTEQYKAEKERSDNLLYQMLPRSVAETLKKDKDVIPESYEQVTVYFSDVVGFTSICHRSKPLQVVQMLNDLYTMFDHIIDEFDVYKVETIGDAYVVVSGLPIRNGDNHAREIARMALRLRHSVSNEFEIRHLPNEKLRLRVGIHTGPVVAGVVGLKMPRYCLFGDTVNTAARMEQSGKENRIHVSSQTKEILDQFETFELKKRRKSVALKGIGELDAWWLIRENGLSTPVPLKKRSFSTISTLVTGLFDDDDHHGVDSNLMLNENDEDEDSLPELSSSMLKPDIHLDYEIKLIQNPPRAALYERRGSALFDFSKSRSTQRIKRRRHGITAKPTPIIEVVEEERNGSIPHDNSELAHTSLSQSTGSNQSVLTTEDSRGRRESYAIVSNQRDSGVSLAYDNSAYSGRKLSDSNSLTTSA